MTDDIKPDTSLYFDWPSKLRALALVLEADPERLQYRPLSSDPWGPSIKNFAETPLLPDMARAVESARLHELAHGVDYRLAPVIPKTLYVDILDGEPARSYADRVPPPPPYPGHERRTYVLKD